MAPLGLIAGLGQLPVAVAAAAVARGQGVCVVRLKGFVEPALDAYPGDIIGIAEIGKVMKTFKQAGCRQVCFAGIVKRPDFADLKPDLKGVSLLPKVLAAARKGDDALLRVLIAAFEAEGFDVIGAHDATGALVTETGCLAGPEPDEDALQDLQKAAHVARESGRLDIGQGAIVCDGLVLCVEAQEGTDAMLMRCASLDEAVRGTQAARRGVLVKRPKPIQDRRIDLPTVGVRTVEAAAAAGLAGIGVETDGALLVDRDAVLARCQALGLFLYGVPKDWA